MLGDERGFGLRICELCIDIYLHYGHMRRPSSGSPKTDGYDSKQGLWLFHICTNLQPTLSAVKKKQPRPQRQYTTASVIPHGYRFRSWNEAQKA